MSNIFETVYFQCANCGQQVLRANTITQPCSECGTALCVPCIREIEAAGEPLVCPKCKTPIEKHGE